MDILEKYIKQYKDGKISLENLKRKLSFLDFREQRNQYKKENRRQENFKKEIKTYINSFEDSIVIDDNYIKKFILEMHRVLSNREYEILELYAVKGLTQAEIGIVLGVTQQAISYTLRIIKKKCAIIAQQYSNYIKQESKEYFLGFTHKYQTNKGKYEFNLPFEGYERSFKNITQCQGSKGDIFYKTSYVCKMPEYLGQKYNGEKTWCTLCKKCTRLKGD